MKSDAELETKDNSNTRVNLYDILSTMYIKDLKKKNPTDKMAIYSSRTHKHKYIAYNRQNLEKLRN
jgi:hypothetical protein